MCTCSHAPVNMIQSLCFTLVTQAWKQLPHKMIVKYSQLMINAQNELLSVRTMMTGICVYPYNNVLYDSRCTQHNVNTSYMVYGVHMHI